MNLQFVGEDSPRFVQHPERQVHFGRLAVAVGLGVFWGGGLLVW